MISKGKILSSKSSRKQYFPAFDLVISRKLCCHRYRILCLFYRHVRWYVGNQWGHICGRTGFVFHLGLDVPAFGSFLLVFDFLLCVCVLSTFILPMFSALLCGRIFGLRFPRDPVFYHPLQVLFRMLRQLAEHPVLPPRIFLLTTDGGLGHENMA